ncbi:MAG: glycoside hydrolase N-terminal domain-containing protein [Candidatus Aminicenantes bacterium]|nr:MAG: glycoside hydrolase N-terminal domain-containing protein [Candidatus Aminicenantes bacterium]
MCINNFSTGFWTRIWLGMFFMLLVFCSVCTKTNNLEKLSEEDIDPTTLLWYTHPADKWENAFPVGNGRLGAMVFGRTYEEMIQFNEETYWSGGPYS